MKELQTLNFKGFNIGIDSYSFHQAFKRTPKILLRNGISLLDFLKKSFSKFGIRHYQIDPYHYNANERRNYSKIKEIVQKNGLFLQLGTVSNFTITGTKWEKKKKRLFADFDDGIKIGGSIFRTTIGGIWSRRIKGDKRNKMIRIIKSNIKDFGTELINHSSTGRWENTKIAIAIENHADFTSEEILDIIDETDHNLVGVNYDTGNALWVKEDPINACRNLASRSFSFHIKDYIIKNTFNRKKQIVGCPLGKGIVELDRQLEIIIGNAPRLQYGEMPILYIENDLRKGDEFEVMKKSLTYFVGDSGI